MGGLAVKTDTDKSFDETIADVITADGEGRASICFTDHAHGLRCSIEERNGTAKTIYGFSVNESIKSALNDAAKLFLDNKLEMFPSIIKAQRAKCRELKGSLKYHEGKLAEMKEREK
jgi:hypothetical protein